MSGISWQRKLEEEEVLEEVMRRSEWKVLAHSWEEEEEDADFAVESNLVWSAQALLRLVTLVMRT